MTTTVFIVEDHPVLQRILCEWIAHLSTMAVSGTARSGKDALQQLLGLDVDLVLLDISLPDMNGIELLKQLRTSKPETRYIVLSRHDDVSRVQKALTAGAQGYLLKHDTYQLSKAIDSVLAGKVYLSPELWSMIPGPKSPE